MFRILNEIKGNQLIGKHEFIIATILKENQLFFKKRGFCQVKEKIAMEVFKSLNLRSDSYL